MWNFYSSLLKRRYLLLGNKSTLMKTLLSFLTVAALIVMSSFTVNQQQQLNNRATAGCFDQFQAHRQGKAGILLTWAVSDPGVVGFSVERSYDGDFYESIASVDFNNARTYRYKDEGVYPGRIYYRIVAHKSDGSSESSLIDVVRIVQRG
jgi:hypothetical protein